MRTPSLRRHKASARGVVTLNNRDVYLGRWPSQCRKPPDDVHQAYDRIIAEWLANGRQLQAPSKDGLTVGELILAFWKHAEQHYRHEDGSPTSEIASFRYSLRPLRQLYENLLANEFSPLKLKATRQAMIDAGLARRHINHQVARIVRMFKWAVSEELVDESIHRALTTVRGLERGRTEARETEPIRPVADTVVDATLPYLLPPVAAMVQVQRLTGARPGEVCWMRACDIDMSGDVWLFRPIAHKGSHRGTDRVIAIGPRCQEIIRPFLKLNTEAYLFSPRDAIAAFRSAQRAARKTRVQPSQLNRKKRKPKKQPGEKYTTDAYSQAIRKVCQRNGIDHWHPHQLRHGHATEVRRRFGLEAAQVAMGHAQANVTEIYAERNIGLAVSVAKQIG